jgi:hypothetical protein
MSFLRGKTHWSRIKLRNGESKRISLDTKDRNLAKTCEAMLDRLRTLREWEILELIAGHSLTAGEVYDYWRKGDDPGPRGRSGERERARSKGTPASFGN